MSETSKIVFCSLRTDRKRCHRSVGLRGAELCLFGVISRVRLEDEYKNASWLGKHEKEMIRTQRIPDEVKSDEVTMDFKKQEIDRRAETLSNQVMEELFLLLNSDTSGTST